MGIEAPTADAHWRTLSQACRLCLLYHGRVEAGRDRDVRIRRRTTRLEENLSILFLQLLCWGLNLYGICLAAEKNLGLLARRNIHFLPNSLLSNVTFL